MINFEPINQTKLYGLEKYFLELVSIYERNNFPSKIIFNGYS